MYNTLTPQPRTFTGYTPPYTNPYPAIPQIQPPMMTVQQTMPIQQQPQQQPQQQGGFNVIPVANIDEAKAVQTPFDGSILILTNINNGKIYTKQLNINTGSAIFNEYSIDTPVQAPASEPNVPQAKYVTEQDLEKLKKELTDKINNMKSEQPTNNTPKFSNSKKEDNK